MLNYSKHIISIYLGINFDNKRHSILGMNIRGLYYEEREGGDEFIYFANKKEKGLRHYFLPKRYYYSR